MNADDNPQSAVTEDIEQKAVEIFQKHLAALEDADAIPFRYSINGIEFSFNIEGLNLSIDSPIIFSVWDFDHAEALAIASHLFRELTLLRVVLYCRGEDGKVDASVFRGENGAQKCLDSVRDTLSNNTLYPLLPPLFRRAIDEVVTLLAEYVAQENEVRLRAMRGSASYGYVYLIQSPTGSYKIGRTRNPNNRMKTFSVKLPFEVDYVCVIETGDMYQLERDLHLRYASKRVNGEWFMLSGDDVAAIQGMVV